MPESSAKTLEELTPSSGGSDIEGDPFGGLDVDWDLLEDLDLEVGSLDEFDLGSDPLESLRLAPDSASKLLGRLSDDLPMPSAGPTSTISTLPSGKKVAIQASAQTTITIQSEFAALLDRICASTGQSRGEYISKMVLDACAPDPIKENSIPLDQMIEIATVLAPDGWGFGVRAVPIRTANESRTIYISELSYPVSSIYSGHTPSMLLEFAQEVRRVAKHGGSAFLRTLSNGSASVEYRASRSRKMVIVDVEVICEGKPFNYAQLKTSSRDVEKLARFFEYIAVVTKLAQAENADDFPVYQTR